MRATADVEVQAGVLRGTVHDGVARFLGVPFAAPPFGERRMRPPAPPDHWTGVREAVHHGATVPKVGYPSPFAPLFPEPSFDGDDCLNLNVWAPVGGLGSGAGPVLVWVHGGAFVNGSGAVGAYDGTSFARDGVICVTINYRLGAEGSLFTSDTGSELANLGLQDQVAALRWVAANIAAFGGDPARVTIAGESAGAMSIAALLAMPSAERLFAQAILQSGAAAHVMPPRTAVAVAEALATALGVPADRAAIAALPPDRVAAAAAAISATAQAEPDPRWGELAMRLLPFAPVVDGTVLPEHPLEAVAAGRSADVRVLQGTNREEGRLFLVAPGLIGQIDDTLLAAGAMAYGLDVEGVAVYRRNRPGASPGDLLAAIVTDWYFAMPAIRFAEARARGGATTFQYRFDHPPATSNGGLGAAHAVEIPFVFDTIHLAEVGPLTGPQPSAEVAALTHATWVRFVHTGEPGWAPYAPSSRTTGLISAHLDVVDDSAGDERALWDGLV